MILSSKSPRHQESVKGSKSPVSQDLRFVPECLSPLFYTAAYHCLSEAQKIRYNQLFGLYLNELAILFETKLPQAYASLLSKSFLSEELKAEIFQFISDEERHWRMFANLNRQAAPEFYRDELHYFVKLPRLALFGLSVLNRLSSVLPLSLILIYLGEEKTLFYPKCFDSSEVALDSRFAAVYKKHVEDEERHIKLDERVLNILWQRLGKSLRQANVSLLKYCLNEFFTQPKRANRKILDQLILEFPDLKALRARIDRELVDAVKSPGFQSTLYSYEVIPGCIKFFRQYKEFISLGQIIPDLLKADSGQG